MQMSAVTRVPSGRVRDTLLVRDHLIAVSDARRGSVSHSAGPDLVGAAAAQVRVFYTAPTLIRSLMQSGDDWVKAHDRSSLRVLGTVGEPIGEHAWNWFGAPYHCRQGQR